MINSDAILFEHLPDGAGHPYRHVPFERNPAQPVTGKTITLGVKVTASDSVERVWVDYRQANIGVSQQIEALCLEVSEQGGIWSVVLPELESGKNYLYQFVASNGHGQKKSEIFNFEVLDTLEVDKMSACYRNQDELLLTFTTNKPTKQVYLKYSLKDDGSVRGCWGVLGDDTEIYRGLIFEELSLGASIQLGKFQFVLTNDRFGVRVSHQLCGVVLDEIHPQRLVVDRDGRLLSVEQSFVSLEDEAFYGFGERFNALNQRGNSLDNVVYEQFTEQGKRSYIPMPFLVSSKGYALYFEIDRYIIFDLAEKDAKSWQYHADVGGEAEFAFRLWADPKPEELIRLTNQYFGKAKLPPDWAFGLWVSANSWDNQKELMEEILKTMAEDIPTTVVVIEAWADETTFYLWNDAEFEKKPSSQAYRYADFSFPGNKRWPDPKGLCDYLHGNGMRLVLWQVPVVKGLHEEDKNHCNQSQHDADQNYVIENGLCLHTEDEDPYLIPQGNWFSKSLVPDFNNPEMVEWWFDKRRYLIEEIGIDGMKTDGGEHIIRNDILSINGEGRDPLRNTFTRLYQRRYSDFLASYRGEDFVLFSRSGYTGAQQYSCHWAGDQDSTWETLRSVIFAGVSAGISGFSFWGWDIGGFASELPTAELYLRSAAMATFCPIMQYHSAPNDNPAVNNTRTPWNIQKHDPSYDVVGIFRHFVNVRMNLIPYILQQARLSAESGLPLMRSVPIFCPDELQARDFPYQYFFGTDLLVAPVVKEGITKWEIYLPKGTWFDLWTGEKLDGEQVVMSDVPIDTIPVYVKAGSILALNLDDSLRLGSPVGNKINEFKNLAFMIFPGTEGEITFEDSQAGQPIKVTCILEGERFSVSVTGTERPVYLIFPNLDVKEIVINGEMASMCQSLDKLNSLEGHGWLRDANGRLIIRPGLVQ